MSNDNQETARQVLEIIPPVMRIVSAELRRAQPAMIPAHLGVLFLLSQQPRNLSELAGLQMVSLPTMSNTVSKMVGEGWVRRTQSERDRRMWLIEITPAGQATLDEMSKRVIAATARLLDKLSADDLDALRKGLTILQRSFIHDATV